MSSPYPNLRPEGQHIFDAAARTYPDDDMIQEGIAFMWKTNEEQAARIDAMAELLDQAMEVFKTYLNVPEAAALREKWEKLKGQ